MELNVSSQTRTIGVVTKDSVSIELERVDCLSYKSMRRELCCQLESLELERHRDIAPFVPFIAQPFYSRGKAIQRREDGFITDVLSGLPGEHLVDQRRFAVVDRVADNGVFVSHFGMRAKIHCAHCKVLQLQRRSPIYRAIMWANIAPVSYTHLT